MHNRRLLFWAACLGMLLFGITMTTLGAILPQVVPKYGVDMADAGSLFTFLSFGILLGSLVFGPIADHNGYKYLLAFCTLLILVGLESIAFAPSFSFLKGAAFVFGFGGGVINGGTNALVADLSEESRSAGLALLGVFFGIGAVGVPLVLGILLRTFSYSIILAGVGAVALVPLLFFLLLRFPRPKQVQRFSLDEAAPLVKRPILLLLGGMLFFESGMEITVGGWTAAYFSEVLALPSDRAILLLSLYWIGLMLARLALGRVLKDRSPAPVLKGSIALAFGGALLLLASQGVILAALGVFLIGAGFAGVFPIVLGYVGDLFPDRSGTAFSVAFTMALTGGMILPYVTGVVGAAYGLRASFLIIPLSLAGLSLLLLFVLRRLSRRYKDVVNL